MATSAWIRAMNNHLQKALCYQGRLDLYDEMEHQQQRIQAGRQNASDHCPGVSFSTISDGTIQPGETTTMGRGTFSIDCLVFISLRSGPVVCLPWSGPHTDTLRGRAMSPK